MFGYNVLRKILPMELKVFIARLFMKKYKNLSVKAFTNSRGAYNEDDLLTEHKNLDFLEEEDFFKAYAGAVEKELYVSPDIRWRLHILCWAASNSSLLEGDFVECGVNKGFSSKIIMDYLNFDKLNKKYYLLDTFNGLDKSLLSDLEQDKYSESIEFEKCIDIVKKTFSDYKNVKIIEGLIPKTLPLVDSDKIAFLHIDMNCVYPEQEALMYFWDKLVKGAIVIFDDYGWTNYADQKQAHDQFAKTKGLKIVTLPTGQGMLIKTI